MDKQFDEVLDLEWRGIPFRATLVREQFNSEFHHIELRADRPLPMTETGYRSHFMHKEQFEQYADLKTFILDWFNEAAESKKWARIQENYAQPSLFD
ncbi:MAG: hypothetical protein AAF429_12440 [Pseudomonadota bacterium]